MAVSHIKASDTPDVEDALRALNKSGTRLAAIAPFACQAHSDNQIKIHSAILKPSSRSPTNVAPQPSGKIATAPSLAPSSVAAEISPERLQQLQATGRDLGVLRQKVEDCGQAKSDLARHRVFSRK